MYINSSNFKIILDRLKVEYTSYDLEYLTKIYNQQESFEIEEIDILNSNDKNKIIQFYESTDIRTFLDINPISIYNNCIYYKQFYLFHGIRFDDDLSKLENIFKVGKILSGNHINTYFHYSDNCNDGKYISLL